MLTAFQRPSSARFSLPVHATHEEIHQASPPPSTVLWYASMSVHLFSTSVYLSVCLFTYISASSCIPVSLYGQLYVHFRSCQSFSSWLLTLHRYSFLYIYIYIYIY